MTEEKKGCKKGGKFSVFVNGFFFGLLSGAAGLFAHKNRDKIKDYISDIKRKKNSSES